MWRVNTSIRFFTVGKVYKSYSENSFNVALKNDTGDIQYVDKKFLDEEKQK